MSSAHEQPEVGVPLLILVTGPPGTGKSAVAEAIAGMTRASVLGHDWAMSGLRAFPPIQETLDAMEPSGHRVTGWSILIALAREQLRSRRPVVLDGVARTPEITMCQTAARHERAQMLLVTTRCSDRAVHRSLIADRQRHIPDWYELDWAHVEESLAGWEPPVGADLGLDASDPWEDNLSRIRELLGAP